MKKITLFLLMIEILNGKRAVSRKIAARIVSQLALAPDEAKTILDLFDRENTLIVQRKFYKIHLCDQKDPHLC